MVGQHPNFTVFAMFNFQQWCHIAALKHICWPSIVPTLSQYHHLQAWACTEPAVKPAINQYQNPNIGPIFRHIFAQPWPDVSVLPGLLLPAHVPACILRRLQVSKGHGIIPELSVRGLRRK